MEYLKSNGETIVAQLHDALSIKHPELTRLQTTDMVWRLVNQKKLKLEYPRTNAFVQFLRHWEINLGIYATFAVSLTLLVAISAIPVNSFFVPLKWILGSAFILLLPGYVATEALFPRVGDLGSTERFALSIGLSLALVMFVGLLLNYTSLGIRTLPIVASLTSITIILGTAAILRRYDRA
jgi:uncharacterized membrane protein